MPPPPPPPPPPPGEGEADLGSALGLALGAGAALAMHRPFDSTSFLRHSIGQTRVSWWRSVLRKVASGSPGVLARLAILANLASDCFVSDDFQSSSSLPA